MAFALRHLALVAAFAILGFAVATADVPKACFLGTEPNPDTDDKVEFVQRPRDPFACDKVMLGGHNTISTVRQAAVYVKSLKPPAVSASGTEGAITTEESDSTPEVTTANMETAGPPPSDCQDIFDTGHTESGVYEIYPEGGATMRVYCSMHRASGEERGYIVFQKRFDGSVSFDEDWDTYNRGFGSLGGEFWLGNSAISMLTATGNWELVVKLESFQNEVAYAHYATFSVSGNKYQLDVDGYSSLLNNDPGDALSNTHQKFFTTSDQDNDESGGKNCAEEFKGGWWFNKCKSLESNLNGEFGTSETVPEYTGIQWATWNGHEAAIRSCEMMMRRSASP